MKNLIKKIGQNKFQFFFFVGILTLLIVALVVSSTSKPVVNEPVDNPPVDIIDNPIKDVVTKPAEVFKRPFDSTMTYTVTRRFYEHDDTKENQALSLIKYNNTYRTSNGVAYAKDDGSSFDVTCIITGKITEIKTNPLFGTYIVIESEDNIKTTYYGINDVCVSTNLEVSQGTKLGKSGETEIDKAAGNHVYVKVTKDGKYMNLEKLIGKKVNEI